MLALATGAANRESVTILAQNFSKKSHRRSPTVLNSFCFQWNWVADAQRRSRRRGQEVNETWRVYNIQSWASRTPAVAALSVRRVVTFAQRGMIAEIMASRRWKKESQSETLSSRCTQSKHKLHSETKNTNLWKITENDIPICLKAVSYNLIVK